MTMEDDLNSTILEKILDALQRRDEKTLSSLSFTPELLTSPISEYYTVAQLIAREGSLNVIPPKILTKEILGQYNALYENCYTYATKTGTFKDIPQHLLDDEVLMLAPNKGTNAQGGEVYSQILHSQILKNVPRHCFTSRLLIDKEYQVTGMNSRISQAALNGQIKDIPKEFLTRETLLEKSDDGDLLLHDIIKRGNLNDLAEEFLKEEYLLFKNDCGQTALHIAAHSGNLKDIPKSLLTPKNLSSPDEYGARPIEETIYGSCTQAIPEELLDSNKLFSSKQEKVKFFDILSDHIDLSSEGEYKEYQNNGFFHSIEKIISTLDQETFDHIRSIPNVKKLTSKEQIKRQLSKRTTPELKIDF
jgi:hypothetical protein